MVPIVFALVPTIVGSSMLVGLNDSGNKGVLLFGEALAANITLITHSSRPAIYLIGTFSSAGTVIYAYNASNISGHTKKARHSCFSQ
jgi:MFS transporter, ACS family, allantoate permease